MTHYPLMGAIPWWLQMEEIIDAGYCLP